MYLYELNKWVFRRLHDDAARILLENWRQSSAGYVRIRFWRRQCGQRMDAARRYSRAYLPDERRMIHVPSSQSCKRPCSAWRAGWTGRRGCRASRRAGGRTRSFCAGDDVNTGNECRYCEHTRTIFVSSSSCCTRMIVSAWRGSWYLETYAWSSGKLIAEGLEKED